MDKNLQLLPTRKKQAYAALCLARFCVANRITHAFITRLVEHLLSVLVAESLPDWERKGTRIELTGRGDPLPKSVAEAVPEHLREIFYYLLDSVVEVGIVDMYGASSNEPFRFLCRCTDVLKKCNVELPALEGCLSPHHGEQQKSSGWGNPINIVEYNGVIDIYRKISTANSK